MPQQTRSRGRVERILEVAAELVVAGGVESINTRVIAAAAGIPVASLYQYFGDKEDILLALVRQDVAEMDRQVADDLDALEVLTVHAIVETTLRAFVTVYHRHPALVVIFMRGRTNQTVRDFCRDHNKARAGDLFALARRAGMVFEDSTGLYAELAVEVTDRLFQIAFEESLEADPLVVEEAISMVSSYLEGHATPSGIAGVTL